MNDELLDLVNEQDQVVEQMLRSEVYGQKKCNFRVVNAFIVNDKEQLWIPRRTSSKRIFPLCLDASMGGHVMAGESYQSAFERELYEELGIQADQFEYEMIGSLNPYEHQTSAFMKVYVIKSQKVPEYNQQDFCEYFWMTPQELISRLSCGDKSKGDLPKIIEQFFIS